MILLGIDPGLVKTGWGVIARERSRLSYISSGRIVPPTDLPMANRLAFLHENLLKVIDLHKPAEVAVEETFVNKNAASALKLGQARGIALCAPALRGVPVYEYAANLVKKSIVGTGHAQKNQVGLMIRMLLSGAGPVSEDEADALAVAICHGHHNAGRKAAAL
jgi:crossover junction endodeoxyribonuclease RuvC